MIKQSLLGCYRGLDLTDEKGMLCGRILADLGADVLKIEPPGGDAARQVGPFYHDQADPEKSLFWMTHNLNKRGITLDLGSSEGKELFTKLVAKVNFIVESFAPGYLDSIGLGYEALAAINPAIVLTSITPFGQSGPYKDYVGADLIVGALGGLMSDCGDPDREPVQVTSPQSYMGACAEAAEGTMLALYEVGSSGQGQHVDVAAIESVAWAVSEKLPYWTIYQYDRTRAGGNLRFMLLGTREDIHLPLMWECKDGFICYAFLGGLPGARNNQKLVELMDARGMATDALKAMDWSKFDLLATDPRELDEKFTQPMKAYFKVCTKRDLYDLAVANALSLYPVNDAKEIREDVQIDVRGFWATVEHPELGDKITYPGAFAIFSETPISFDRRPPLIGEHNEEVFVKELGCSQEQIAQWKKSKAI